MTKKNRYTGALTVGDANRSSFTRLTTTSGVGMGAGGLGVSGMSGGSSAAQNASTNSLPNTVTSSNTVPTPATAQSGSTSARRRTASGSGDDVKMTDVSNSASAKNLA